MTRFVIWLIVNFFSTFSVVFLFYKVNNISKKINIKISILFIIGVIIQTVIQYYELSNLRIASYFLYFPILFYMIKPVPIKKLVFFVLVVWFCGMATDILALLLFTAIFFLLQIDFNWYMNNSDYVSMLFTAFVSILLIFISYKNFLNKPINKVYDKFDNINYLNFLLIVFAVFILCFTIIMFLNVESLSMNLLLMIIIVLMTVTFIVLLRFKINEDENAKYLKTLKENNEFYIKVDDENRVFKHNLVAKLLSIKSVSNKKAMALIEDLIMQFNKSVEFSNSIKIIPYGLNGIIYQKLYPYLKDLDIKINNEITYDIFTVLKPRRYNVLVEKIVVSLDNAIESSLKSKDKSIVINISDIDDNICVEIKNTIGNDINMDLLGDKNYSTNGIKRGLGLFSILRNNEASVSVKIINNIFVSRIVAKKRLTD